MKVTKFEYHKRSGVGIIGPWQDPPIWVATVETDGGHTLHFSRDDEERQWYADAHFGPDGYPYFCHGEGSRCTKKQVAHGELADLLDQHMRNWEGGPVPAYGVA